MEDDGETGMQYWNDRPSCQVRPLALLVQTEKIMQKRKKRLEYSLPSLSYLTKILNFPRYLLRFMNLNF